MSPPLGLEIGDCLELGIDIDGIAPRIKIGQPQHAIRHLGQYRRLQRIDD